jgi:hypothetical protein
MRCFGDLGIDRVIALVGCGGDDLDIDAHPVEVRKAPIDRRHHVSNIAFLLCVDFPGRGVCKMSQRDACDIDVRLGESRGWWDHNVGVDVDRWGWWTSGEAVGIMNSGGGAPVTILSI